MQLFMVGHHDTVEDSFWRVAAESPEQAAQLYIQAMIDEEISVDEEELADLGELEVQTLIPEMPAAPGVIQWCHRRTRIALEDIDAWQPYRGDTMEP